MPQNREEAASTSSQDLVAASRRSDEWCSAFVCPDCRRHGVEADDEGCVYVYCAECGEVLSDMALPVAKGERGARKARRHIEWLCQFLKLNKDVQDAAKKVLEVAVMCDQLDPGRLRMNKKHFSGALVYLICRIRQCPVLLLEIAEAVQRSIRCVGRAYKRLVTMLNLDKFFLIPLVDPTFFLDYFASKLYLGKKKQREVTILAARIIAVMKRDWMSTGREPPGLCGAALLVACRARGCELSREQVADAVRCGKTVLRDRLHELSKTPLAVQRPAELEELKLPRPNEWDMAQFDSKMLPPAKQKSLAKEDIVDPFDDDIETLAERLSRARQVQHLKVGPIDDVSSGLSDVDDDELEVQLLDDDEMEAKAAIWHRVNKSLIDVCDDPAHVTMPKMQSKYRQLTEAHKKRSRKVLEDRSAVKKARSSKAKEMKKTLSAMRLQEGKEALSGDRAATIS